jgi:hypothetical protein
MMKKILLIAAAIVLLGVLYLQAEKKEQRPANKTSEAAPVSAVDVDVPPADDVRAKVQRPKPVSDLRTAFERSDDLYALMATHARSGGAESLWLISKIADYCAEFGRNPAKYASDTQHILAVATVDPEFYQEARSKVSYRCRGFLAAETKDDITHAALLVHKTRAAHAGSLAGEAALLSQRAPLSADNEYLKNLVNRVMNSNDPDAYAALSMTMVDDRILPLIRQEVGSISGGENGIYAWYLAACRIGLDCTRGGALMTRMCAEAFICGREDNFERMVFNRELSLIEAEKIRQMVSTIIKK